jgi:lipoate-protein ligase A
MSLKCRELGKTLKLKGEFKMADLNEYLTVIREIKEQYSYDEFIEKVFEEFEERFENIEDVRCVFSLR